MTLKTLLENEHCVLLLKTILRTGSILLLNVYSVLRAWELIVPNALYAASARLMTNPKWNLVIDACWTFNDSVIIIETPYYCSITMIFFENMTDFINY